MKILPSLPKTTWGEWYRSPEVIRRFPDIVEAMGPRSDYQLMESGIGVVNGQGLYNRPLHGPGSRTTISAGDLPRAAMSAVMVKLYDWMKFGELALGVEIAGRAKWLHQFDDHTSIYLPGFMRYHLRDSAFPHLRITTEIVPLISGNGAIVRCAFRSDQELDLHWFWMFGAMFVCNYREPGNETRLYDPGLKVPELRFQHARDNEVALRDNGFRIRSHRTRRVLVCGGSDLGQPYCRVDAEQAERHPQRAFASQAKPRLPMAGQRASLHLEAGKTKRCHLIVLWGASEDDPARQVSQFLETPEAVYCRSVEYFQSIAHQVKTSTPDARFDMAVRINNVATDANWRPPSFLHSPCSWALLGPIWRHWYGPTALGWHERVESALRFHAPFRSYARSRGYDSRGKLFPLIPLNRVESCRRRAKSRGGGYDGNHLYLDFAYCHYCSTNDRQLIRELWPHLKEIWGWEHREMLTPIAGLYTNVLNTFISDQHWYYRGGCTQQSAYMWKCSRIMTEFARVVGEDDTLYRAEAARIGKALMENLWLSDRGYFAEYLDTTGRIHPVPELPSIYHPIELDLLDPLQSYQALRFVEERLWQPHDLALVNDWYPMMWDHHIAHPQENLNLALAYYRIGEGDRAYRLVKAAVNSQFDHSVCPGALLATFASDGTSYCIYEFADTVGLFGRVLVEGLFGIRPRMQQGEIEITPCLPTVWNHASLETPDVSVRYQRTRTRFSVEATSTKPVAKHFRLPLPACRVKLVRLNGKQVAYRLVPGIDCTYLEVKTPAAKGPHRLEAEYVPAKLTVTAPEVAARGDEFQIHLEGGHATEVRDPQGVFQALAILDQGKAVTGRVGAGPGHHTLFLSVQAGETEVIWPINVEVRDPVEISGGEIKISGRAGSYRFPLRNNMTKALAVEIESHFLGQRNRREIVLPAMDETQVRFRSRPETLSRLTPGRQEVRVIISGEYEGILTAQLVDWSVAGQLARRKQRFTPISLRRYWSENLRKITEDLGSGARRQIFESRVGEMEDGRLYESRKSNQPFLSPIGVPFSLGPRNGKNAVFVSTGISRFSGHYDHPSPEEYSSHPRHYPQQITIPVKRRAEKVYLLLTASLDHMQCHIPNARVTIHYRGRRVQTEDLTPPQDLDLVFQHYSDNYGFLIGSHKFNAHLDIRDILTDPDFPIEAITIEALTMQTSLVVLGMTLLEPFDQGE